MLDKLQADLRMWRVLTLMSVGEGGSTFVNELSAPSRDPEGDGVGVGERDETEKVTEAPGARLKRARCGSIDCGKA